MVRKVKHSRFVVTVNSNKHYTDENELEKFKRGCRLLFSKHIVKTFRYNTNYTEDKGPIKKYLKSVDVKYSFERGSDKKRDHIHCIIEVSHTTMMKIDAGVIRKFFETQVVMSKVHVNIRAGTNQTKTLVDYISKQETITSHKIL